MGLLSGLTDTIFPGVSDLASGAKDAFGVLSGSTAYNDAANKVNFEPFNISTGTGALNWNGNSGSYTLSPEYQALRDQTLGGAKGFFSQAQSFDPNAAASNAYGLMQSIVAPQRATDLANLQSTLFGRGQLGLADSTGGNPTMTSYFNSLNNADKQMALGSIDLGQTLQNNLLTRGTTMLNAGRGIDTTGNSILNDSINAGMGGLRASLGVADFTAKAGTAESNFWNNLIGGAAKAYGIPGL